MSQSPPALALFKRPYSLDTLFTLMFVLSCLSCFSIPVRLTGARDFGLGHPPLLPVPDSDHSNTFETEFYPTYSTTSIWGLCSMGVGKILFAALIGFGPDKQVEGCRLHCTMH